jgi:hypothetical protein
MKRLILCATALLGLCVAEGATAQAACDRTKSLLSCFQDIGLAAERAQAQALVDDPGLATTEAAHAVEQAVDETKEDTKKALAEAKPSADTGGASTATTLTDFAPLFDALGLLSSGDSTGDQLAFNLNFLVPIQKTDSPNTQFQLLVNTQPEPLDQLVQSFDESVREARKDSLQKDVSTFGDQQLKFNWSLVNSRFGRDFRPLRKYLGPIYDGAAARARQSGNARTQKEKLRRFHEALGKAGVELRDANLTPIKDLAVSDEVKAQLIADTMAAANARVALMTMLHEEITGSNLYRLAELVEVQPQLLFAVSHNFRDEIVGPEKTSATITWEWSKKNIGAFIHDEGAACRQADVGLGGASYEKCSAALERYLSEDLKKQWRFKLAASYQKVDAVSYSFPDDGVALDLPKTDRLELTVGGGREFSGKPDLGRLDIELSYDSNVDGDAANKDRIKAAITLTRRVGDVDVPFSIVYANKDEFLGEVDHQIGMHIGVKFRQPKQ